MKRSKRIFALAGALLLVCLYVSTLIFALIDSPLFSDLLKISIAATIFLPVLLYAYTLIYRLAKQSNTDDDADEKH